MHNGYFPNATMPYGIFYQRWEKAGCWALVAVPPEKINWELDAEESLSVGCILERCEKYELAFKHYQKALELAEQIKDQKKKHDLLFRVMFNTANVYMATKQFPKAEKILTNLKKKTEGNGPILNNLAEIYLSEGKDLKKAEELVKKAIQLDKKNAVYYLDTFAKILMEKKKYSDAEKLLQQALKITRQKKIRSVLYYHLGTVKFSTGQFRQAFELYAKAVDEVDEEQEPARECEYTLQYAVCGLKIGEVKRAREGLYKVIALDRSELAWKAREELIKIKDK
jgi:tetratricopeptide (TPR) repeat protein